MPPRRRFDKKSAQTFSIVNRAHDDSRYFDEDALQHVLVPVGKSKKNEKVPQLTNESAKKRIYSTEELMSKLKPEEVQAVRANEGLAAQYGVYFDDSKYDYMQHLKPIGKNQDAVFIEANEKKEKPKMKVEDLFKDQLPSESKRHVEYDAYENIPEEFRGLNPDLDPRLREILEALEDEAYLIDQEKKKNEEAEMDDDDIFATLLQSGEVEDEDDFYYGSDADQYYDDYDENYDEWDLDNYEDEYNAKYESDNFEEPEHAYNEGEAPEELEAAIKDDEIEAPVLNTGWEKDFMKFKAQLKNKPNDWDSDDEFEDEEDDVLAELPVNDKKVSKTKLRKKKGAMTDTTSFSMSSSALFRTEGLTLLDDRYEQLSKKFEKEDDDQYEEFDMSKERGDLEGMLDDFLDNYELESGGRKLVKKDEEHKRLQEAADSVSKGKAAARRRKMKQSSALDKLGGSFGNMKI